MSYLGDDFDFGEAFGVQGDPTIEEKEGYNTFPDGDVEVNGIFGFFGKGVSKEGVPFFVPDKFGNMVVRINLRLVDGTQGPPCTATRAELAAIVSAFGGDESKLPKGENPQFLLKAQELANIAGRVRKCNVYEGWTRPGRIDGAAPAGGVLYTWKYVGARSPKGTEPVCFEDKTFNYASGAVTESIAYLKFEIVSDAYGANTPFDGYVMDVTFYNPFDGSTVTDAAGRKKPGTRIGQRGGIPIEVERLKRFCGWFAPDVLSHRWEADPTKSELGINEIENPLAVIDKIAREAGRVAVAQIEYTKSKTNPKPKLDLMSFSAAAPKTIDRDAKAAVEASQPEPLFRLVQAIEKLAHPVKVFKDTPKDSDTINLDMTEPDGKNWARAVLVPAWEKLGLPVDSKGVRKIALLSPEQMNALREYLVPPFDVDETVSVEKAAEEGF